MGLTQLRMERATLCRVAHPTLAAGGDPADKPDQARGAPPPVKTRGRHHSIPARCLRGLEGAVGEWTLHALCHNRRKLANSGVRPRCLASA